ncbi:MAG: DNA translocase FtsK 4TM domain-containing protein [Thermoanaerobaculia bacterium]|nr:DNA translocase FtsK 4TM domain-containing protein [Thermoanaerobaculia bacterium]
MKASGEAKPDRGRVELSAAKGREIVGFVSISLAALLAASLLSHLPSDPSFLHQSSAAREVRNQIGRFGAQVSAAGFGFLGITSLLLPLLLAGFGLRRLRKRPPLRVVGRGVGALLLTASLPGLVHLLQARIPWRGEALETGGAFGLLLGDGLAARMNLPGALVVLATVALVGTVLLVQTSLGEVIAAWRARLRAAWERLQLARARRRERRAKEQARRRVIVKHLQRAAEERSREAATAQEEGERGRGRPDPDLPIAPPSPAPLRVTPRAGEPGFAVRRVGPAAAREAAPPPPPAAPQRQLPFEAEAAAPSLPPLNLLQMDEARAQVDEDELVRLGEAIRARCAEFGVDGTIEGSAPGR